MKRFITAVLIVATVLMAMAVPTNAESRYIEKQFVFGTYAPTVIIHHPVYDWVLTAKGDKLSWQKPNGSNSQRFVILPTRYDGYFAFREFNNGTTEQMYITYTSSGFKLAKPGTDRYGMEVVKDTQVYRFVWKATDSCGGKTFKNTFRLPCRNKICLCVGGWGNFRLEQTNAG